MTVVNSKEIHRLHSLYMCGMSFAKLAKNHGKGLTRQSIHQYFKRMNLPTRPLKRTKQLKYNGENYTWAKDDYWRKTTGNREALHRQVWRNEFGDIPKGYDIVPLDRDKATTDPSNLEIVEHEELKKRFISNNQFTKGRKEIVIQEIVCKNCETLVPYRGPSPSAHNRRKFCDSKCKYAYDKKTNNTILERKRRSLEL